MVWNWSNLFAKNLMWGEMTKSSFLRKELCLAYLATVMVMKYGRLLFFKTEIWWWVVSHTVTRVYPDNPTCYPLLMLTLWQIDWALFYFGFFETFCQSRERAIFSTFIFAVKGSGFFSGLLIFLALGWNFLTTTFWKRNQ